jgi:hypothetical protein
MKKLAVIAAFATAGIYASYAGAQEIATFDNPYALTQRYASWTNSNITAGKTTLTSNPTNYETASTAGYGSGYFQIYPKVIDISQSQYLQLDFTVNSGVAGMLVDLDDGEGDEYQYLFGYGHIPGGGMNGGNEYIVDVPLATPYNVINSYNQPGQTIPFDFSQIVAYNIELDPGSAPAGGPNPYDVSWNDLSAVNLPEPASLGLGSLAFAALASRRRK